MDRIKGRGGVPQTRPQSSSSEKIQRQAGIERDRSRRSGRCLSVPPPAGEAQRLTFRQPGLGHLAGQVADEPMVAVRSVTEITRASSRLKVWLLSTK